MKYMDGEVRPGMCSRCHGIILSSHFDQRDFIPEPFRLGQPQPVTLSPLPASFNYNVPFSSPSSSSSFPS
eukprot:739877-Hanusia_phi.AAC.6